MTPKYPIRINVAIPMPSRIPPMIFVCFKMNGTIIAMIEYNGYAYLYINIFPLLWFFFTE